MREAVFMDILFYGLAVAGALLLVWMMLTRWLGVSFSSMRRPVAIRKYFIEAWAVFQRVKRFGWILTGVMLMLYVLNLLYSILLLDAPEMGNVVDAMLADRPGAAEYITNLPYALLIRVGTSAWGLCYAFRSAETIPILFIIAYMVKKWAADIGPACIEKTYKVYKLLAIGCIAAIIVVMIKVSNVRMMDMFFVNKWTAGLYAFTVFSVTLIIINFAALLLAASIGEGLFIHITNSIQCGEELPLKDAFKKSLNSLKALYLFNLVYFALPVVLSYSYYFLMKRSVEASASDLFLFMSGAGVTGKGYVDLIIMLGRTLLFLTPFTIIMDGHAISEGVRKSLKTVFGAPLDYVSIFILFGMVSWAGVSVLHAVSQFILLPLTLNYYLWSIGYYVLPGVLSIWISLFGFCVFSVFMRESSIREENKQPSQA